MMFEPTSAIHVEKYTVADVAKILVMFKLKTARLVREAAKMHIGQITNMKGKMLAE